MELDRNHPVISRVGEPPPHNAGFIRASLVVGCQQWQKEVNAQEYEAILIEEETR